MLSEDQSIEKDTVFFRIERTTRDFLTINRVSPTSSSFYAGACGVIGVSWCLLSLYLSGPIFVAPNACRLVTYCAGLIQCLITNKMCHAIGTQCDLVIDIYNKGYDLCCDDYYNRLKAAPYENEKLRDSKKPVVSKVSTSLSR